MQSTLNVIAFGKDDIDNKLSTLSGRQIDELAFGAIQLDGQGRILRYNEAEAEITGRKAERRHRHQLLPRRRPVHEHGALQGRVRRRRAREQPEHDVRVRVRLQDDADQGKDPHEESHQRRQLSGFSSSACKHARIQARPRPRGGPTAARCCASSPTWWRASWPCLRHEPLLLPTGWSASLSLQHDLGVDSLELLQLAGVAGRSRADGAQRHRGLPAGAPQPGRLARHRRHEPAALGRRADFPHLGQHGRAEALHARARRAGAGSRRPGRAVPAAAPAAAGGALPPHLRFPVRRAAAAPPGPAGRSRWTACAGACPRSWRRRRSRATWWSAIRSSGRRRSGRTPCSRRT
jgi:photoactive yellow protein